MTSEISFAIQAAERILAVSSKRPMCNLYPQVYEATGEAVRVDCGELAFSIVSQPIIAQMADRVLHARHGEITL
ncbi:hypothetical protein, partial [Pseudomonas sp. PA-3-11C]|uniref:hypothetical protein n=1 Tax=Pseudomonas sp. PA-3-11C TaxID=2665472 RepID=UPI001F368F35